MNTSILLEEAIETTIIAFVFWIAIRIYKRQEVKKQEKLKEKIKKEIIAQLAEQNKKEEQVEREIKETFMRSFPDESYYRNNKITTTEKTDPYWYCWLKEKAFKKENFCFGIDEDVKPRYVLNCIFTTAISYVYIFEVFQNDSFFKNQAIIALNGFLNRQGKVTVLLSEYPDENNLSDLLEFLKYKIISGNKNVSILIINPVSLVELGEYKFFFLVADTKMYFDRNVKGKINIGNFNDSKNCKGLLTLFMRCSKTATEYTFQRIDYENMTEEELKILLEKSNDSQKFEESADIRDELLLRKGLLKETEFSTRRVQKKLIAVSEKRRVEDKYLSHNE
ncbi:MAG: hypothetical protein NTW62_00670 [Candidatus Nomurabacteria bacterium]|nr:hypothetical protein [Candidatus Nomurabacteria bacterium]